MEKVRQHTQVNCNTKDHTLYTCRTVPYDHLGMIECKQCCRRRHFPYSVVGVELLRIHHFIFHLSHHTSRFAATHVADAKPHPDLRDGAEEESHEPEENKPKEGRKWSQSR